MKKRIYRNIAAILSAVLLFTAMPFTSLADFQAEVIDGYSGETEDVEYSDEEFETEQEDFESDTEDVQESEGDLLGRQNLKTADNADNMTEEDYQELLVPLGNDGVEYEAADPNIVSDTELLQAAKLPSSYDARKYGYVPAVRSQKRSGTCFAHSVIAPVEIAMIKKGYAGKNVNLSEGVLTYFTYKIPNDSLGNYTNNSVTRNLSISRGGFTDRCTVGIWGWSDLVSEGFKSTRFDAIYPYLEYKTTNKDTEAQKAQHLKEEKQNEKKLSIPSYFAHGQYRLQYIKNGNKYYYGYNPVILQDAFFINSKQITLIKQKIYTYGAVSASYLSTSEKAMAELKHVGNTACKIKGKTGTYEKYNGDCTIFNTDNNPKQSDSNHAITIIGWDDNYPKELFNKGATGKMPKNNGAWIIRNSWGTNSGNKGYYMISYEDPTLNGFIAYNYLNATDKNDKGLYYQYNYQLDATPNTGYITLAKGSYAANVYTIKGTGNQEIAAVSTGFMNAGVEYKIALYKWNKSIGNTVKNENLIACYQDSFPTAGIHTYTIPEGKRPVLKGGQKFAVVVIPLNKAARLMSDYSITYTTRSGESWVYTHPSKKNSSFLGVKGKKLNWSSCLYTGKNKDNTKFTTDANWRIKVYTNDTRKQASSALLGAEGTTGGAGETYFSSQSNTGTRQRGGNLLGSEEAAEAEPEVTEENEPGDGVDVLHFINLGEEDAEAEEETGEASEEPAVEEGEDSLALYVIKGDEFELFHDTSDEFGEDGVSAEYSEYSWEITEQKPAQGESQVISWGAHKATRSDASYLVSMAGDAVGNGTATAKVKGKNSGTKAWEDLEFYHIIVKAQDSTPDVPSDMNGTDLEYLCVDESYLIELVADSLTDEYRFKAAYSALDGSNTIPEEKQGGIDIGTPQVIEADVEEGEESIESYVAFVDVTGAKEGYVYVTAEKKIGEEWTPVGIMEFVVVNEFTDLEKIVSQEKVRLTKGQSIVLTPDITGLQLSELAEEEGLYSFYWAVDDEEVFRMEWAFDEEEELTEDEFFALKLTGETEGEATLYFSLYNEFYWVDERVWEIPVTVTAGGSSSDEEESSTPAVIRGTGVEGTWVQNADGSWSCSSGGKAFVNQWAYLYNPWQKTGLQSQWFWFDDKGKLLAGWQWIKGSDGLYRCYYLNPKHDGAYGACLLGGTTSDGYTVNASGAWTQNGVEVTRKEL